MNLSDLLRMTKEIMNREGDIEVRYETGFMKIEPDLKVREVNNKKVLVISNGFTQR